MFRDNQSINQGIGSSIPFRSAEPLVNRILSYPEAFVSGKVPSLVFCENAPIPNEKRSLRVLITYAVLIVESSLYRHAIIMHAVFITVIAI